MHNSGTAIRFWRSYARAHAGALLFAFPLLMTMEMWWLGMYLDRSRLALFVALLLPVLVGLSRFSGFKPTRGWYDDAIDAFVAFGAGVTTTIVFLVVFGILQPGMLWSEIFGKIAVLTVPASIGAILASKQLGRDESRDEKRRAGYAGELFIMGAGALFVSFNVAPTEEMLLIAFRMTPWHAVALVLFSVAILHALVYALGFAGGHPQPGEANRRGLTLFFSLVGYVLALLVSAYVLWTFGRFDGVAWPRIVMITAVLGFPAAFGAGLARLVI